MLGGISIGEEEERRHRPAIQNEISFLIVIFFFLGGGKRLSIVFDLVAGEGEEEWVKKPSQRRIGMWIGRVGGETIVEQLKLFFIYVQYNATWRDDEQK